MPKPGDRIKIITEDKEVEGILMPRPGILDKDVTIVKLDNGYNIGIENKKIKKTEVIKEYKTRKTRKTKLKENPDLPSVSILSVGGTISSKIDYRTGGVYADYTAEDFVEMMPELSEIANLKAKKIMSVMSEDMNSTDWLKIAKEIEKELNSGTDGVVITQGTDTFHFSTAALSFLLKDLTKPVVFTAAQRSIDRGSSDAFMNLFCAITAAAKLDAAEVMGCMHGTLNDDYCLLIRGTKVRKMHTSRRDAFRPINDMPIARIFQDGKIEVLNKNYKKRNQEKTKAENKFEEKVALIAIYPGMDPKIIDFYIKEGYKGIVLAATALGHVPTTKEKYSLLKNLKKATDKKIPVIIATQTIYGRVHPYVYTNLRKLSIQLNCIFAEDMLVETAYVKLGYVLGQTKDLEKIKQLMLTNIAGEITTRSLPNTFLK